MFTEADKKQIESRGMTVEQVERQLVQHKEGFPFLKIEAAAAVGKGIIAPDATAQKEAEQAWEDYKREGHKVVKFVPASGAASRMFKNMFAFLSADYDTPQTECEKTFFDNIKKFAFRKALCQKCHANNDACAKDLIAEGNYKAVVANMLKPEGLNCPRACFCSTNTRTAPAHRWRNTWWRPRSTPAAMARPTSISP